MHAITVVVVLGIHAMACGRIGFESNGANDAARNADGRVDPSVIEVRLLGEDDTPEEGQPIANATVMFVGSESLVRTTDADGLARATVSGPTTIYAGYPAMLPAAPVPVEGLRYYTVVDVVGGSAVTLGSVPPPVIDVVTITVNVPGFLGASRYELSGPRRCGIDDSSPNNTIVSAINGCTGETIPIFATAYNGTAKAGWLDAGLRVASDGATYTTGAMWQMFGTQRVTYPGVPSSIFVAASLASETGSDRVTLGEAGDPGAAGDRVDTILVSGGSVDVIEVTYSPGLAAPPFAILAEPAPIEAGGIRAFDTSRLMQVVDVVTPTTNGLTWTLLPVARVSTAILAELQYTTTGGVPVAWSFATRGDTTSIGIPALPAPLDALAPDASTFNGVFANVASGSLDYEELVPELLTGGQDVIALGELPVGSAIGLGSVGEISSVSRSRVEQRARRAIISAAD